MGPKRKAEVKKFQIKKEFTPSAPLFNRLKYVQTASSQTTILKFGNSLGIPCILMELCSPTFGSFYLSYLDFRNYFSCVKNCIDERLLFTIASSKLSLRVI